MSKIMKAPEGLIPEYPAERSRDSWIPILGCLLKHGDRIMLDPEDQYVFQVFEEKTEEGVKKYLRHPIFSTSVKKHPVKELVYYFAEMTRRNC